PASSPLGLWIANSDEPTNPTKDYCVYETAVPAGHTILDFNNTVTIEPGETNTFELTVENLRTEGPDLPLTGAQGTMVMTLGGLLLVGAGAGALVVSRRRNEA
ncbi:MAG: LPXTG cell wall anchor domain-containing protein, partial [Propioniciclava sp.]|nr:LPXTG cell wall anchor domain-containing protein [Propioniciclava sp.]